MLSAVLFINLLGDIIIQRYFRDDIPSTAADMFRQQLIAGKFSLPVVQIDGITFLFTRQNDVYVVAATRLNANAMTAFEFMCSTINVFSAYFGNLFTEEAIRDNFVVTYELLDEMMDSGYPQLTAINTLKGAISLGQAKGSGQEAATYNTPARLDRLTSFITGSVDWREVGKHQYKKNEVFMDVHEAVNVLISADGSILRADVSGKIVMKTFLSGMPECRFGLNDSLVMNREPTRPGTRPSPVNAPQLGSLGGAGGAAGGIAIDDVTLHRCVQLTQFDQDRTVSFIPPDGEFTLMKYRVTSNVKIPFTITPSVIARGRSKVEYQITIRGNFDSSLTASNVRLLIPVPDNTASVTASPNHGKAKFKPLLNAIQWKIPKFTGKGVYVLRAEASLAATVDDKQWARPPINVEFEVPMFTASGLRVRFLKVVERSNYEASKWVRYLTKGGTYNVRI